MSTTAGVFLLWSGLVLASCSGATAPRLDGAGASDANAAETRGDATADVVAPDSGADPSDTGAGWADGADDRVEATAEESETAQIGDVLAVNDLQVRENPNAGLSILVSFRTDEPTLGSVVVGTAGEAPAVVSEASGVASTDHEILVLGLLPDRDYQVTARATTVDEKAKGESSATYRSEPLPVPFPALVAQTLRPDLMPPGFIAFPLSKRRQEDGFGPGQDDVPPIDDFPDTLVIVDREGRVVWYKRFPWLTKRIMGFSRLGNGHFVILGHFGLIEFDLSGAIVNQLTEQDLDLGGFLDHDVVLLPNGNYVSLVTEIRPLDSDGVHLDEAQVEDVIEFTRTGETVRRVPLDKVFPIKASMLVRTDANGDVKTAREIFHANSLQYDPSDGTVTVSLFFLGAVVRFVLETGVLVWTAGEGGTVQMTGGGKWFVSAHGIDMQPDGVLSVFDNRWPPFQSDALPGPARAAAFTIQKDGAGAYRAEQVFSHESDAFVPFMGSVQHIGGTGTYLVCAGARVVTVDPPKLSPVIEIVTSDTPSANVFALKAVPVPEWSGSEHSSGPDLLTIYRAYHLDDLSVGHD